MTTCELKELGETFLKRLDVTRICPEVDFESERPSGQTVSLTSWRKQIAGGREASVGRPGINLDRSMTGSGKSYGDRVAIELAGRAMTVTPTHEQCGEVVTDLTKAGIKAVAFPKRTTEGETPNCWNKEADLAEAAGLPVVATVCLGCSLRESCTDKLSGNEGYLCQVQRAEAANVVVATHARVTASGLEGRATKWPLMFIHEDATDVLFPQSELTVDALEKASGVIGHLLTSPKWLDWFGQTAGRDSEGNSKPFTQARIQGREELDRFVRHLDRCVALLLQQLRSAVEATQLPECEVMPRPIRTHWILWNAQKESNVTFDRGESPWSALLTLASDKTCGLEIHVEEIDDDTTIEKADCDSKESAVSRFDTLAV